MERHDDRVPQATCSLQGRSQLDRRLLVEGGNFVCGGRFEARYNEGRARLDVAQRGIRMRRTYAEERNRGREAIDEKSCALHLRAKDRSVAHVVVARKNDHPCARAPGGQVEKPADDPRTRVAFPGSSAADALRLG